MEPDAARKDWSEKREGERGRETRSETGDGRMRYASRPMVDGPMQVRGMRNQDVLFSHETQIVVGEKGLR